MKSQKIRDLDETELQHQLRTIEEQLFRLNFPLVQIANLLCLHIRYSASSRPTNLVLMGSL